VASASCVDDGLGDASKQVLQPNPAHQSVACPTLKESKWSNWPNSTFLNNRTLLLLFVLVHDYYI